MHVNASEVCNDFSIPLAHQRTRQSPRTGQSRAARAAAAALSVSAACVVIVPATTQRLGQSSADSSPHTSNSKLVRLQVFDRFCIYSAILHSRALTALACDSTLSLIHI